MNQETQYKLQAYLDGELPVSERAQVEALLRQDAGAAALLAELRNTTGALAGFEAEIKLAESREFYWSKIRREIQREPAPTRLEESWGRAWLRRFLMPAGAAAAVLIAILLSLPGGGGAADYFSASGDAVTFTYQDYNTGTTLVWLDFLPENDFSDSESDDTLDL